MLKMWKVYGVKGHRQRESFADSSVTQLNDNSFIYVVNSDITKTNDYSVVAISSEKIESCNDILEGQLSDGIFENSKVGEVVEIDICDSRNIDMLIRLMKKIWLG